MTNKEIEQIQRNLDYFSEVWKRESFKISVLEAKYWNQKMEILYGTR